MFSEDFLKEEYLADPYSWVITKDHICEGESVGVIGPRFTKMKAQEIKKKGKHFKMYDDDWNLYYEGYLVGGSGLEPLDDFGTYMAGAVHIKIRNLKTNKYEEI